MSETRRAIVPDMFVDERERACGVILEHDRDAVALCTPCARHVGHVDV